MGKLKSFFTYFDANEEQLRNLILQFIMFPTTEQMYLMQYRRQLTHLHDSCKHFLQEDNHCRQRSLTKENAELEKYKIMRYK